MASPVKARPPSYEETMERLGRSPEDEKKREAPGSTGHRSKEHLTLGVDESGSRPVEIGVDVSLGSHLYEKTIKQLERSPEDHEKSEPATSSSLHGRHIYENEGVDEFGGSQTYAVVDESGIGPEFSGEPATISHTMIQPRMVQQPASVHLPLTVRLPSEEPPGHYTRRKRMKKSMSRSASKTSTKSGDAAVQREASIDSYLSPSTPEGYDPNAPYKPMETRVGADGKTYLGETSIEVVVPEVHETPNTKIVYGPPAKPNDYLWYSIVGLVCFVFFGAISFMKSRQVREKFNKKDYTGAQEASAAARNWATAALFTGSFTVAVFIFVLFVSPCPLARWLGYESICPPGE